MAAAEVRFIEPDEQREWLRSEQRSFGIEPDDTRLDELTPAIEGERACAAFDGGRIVATGTTEQVRDGKTLQQAFIDLVDPHARDEEGLSWLGASSS